MRSIALACCLFLGLAAAAMAQATAGYSAHSGDAALTYHWVHTNAPPNGGCGCFALNGVGASASLNLTTHVAVVAEFSIDHTSKALASNNSLSLTSFMGGARYHLPNPWMHGVHALQPFAQVLVGGARAGGGIAGVADHTSALAGRLGGGIDLPVSALLTLRIAQGDYYMTTFANTADNRQNNLLFGAGIVFNWSR